MIKIRESELQQKWGEGAEGEWGPERGFMLKQNQ
jgi:hypothetical protein